MKQQKSEKLEVYYNSACPVCDAGINFQRSKTTDCDVNWKDIHANAAFAQEAHSNINFVRKYLHVIDSQGQKHIGIDAFIQLWKYSPKEQWKAELLSIPICRGIAKIIYFIFANALFTWNRLMKNWSH